MSGVVAAAGFSDAWWAVWLCAAGRILASKHRSDAPRTSANDGRECVDIQFAAHWILGGIVRLMPFRVRFVQAQTLLLVLGYWLEASERSYL